MLRPFIPAENGTAARKTKNRAERIVERVLSLDPGRSQGELSRILSALSGRHTNLEGTLRQGFRSVAERHLHGRPITPEQELLIGAYFTEEYSFEAAALFNPGVVVHPDQSGAPKNTTRVLISLRAVGEGHVSSICFRTAIFDGEDLEIAPAAPLAGSPEIAEIPGGKPNDPWIRLTYGDAHDPSQIVIFPVTYAQRHGIEDLRLTRFVDEDGQQAYFGTYTAFSGEGIRQELLRTVDFKTFELSVLRGEHSATKGMALFPRLIGGCYAMLGRHDHENIWLLTSSDIHCWNEGEVIVSPRWPWEFIQMGNSGPPIELDEGWLVITHGVGPIRGYCLGACLLDKKKPWKVLARSTEPLLRPNPTMRDGYVPNVVYSCGALAVGRTLLLPYGIADTFTAFATVEVDALLSTLS